MLTLVVSAWSGELRTGPASPSLDLHGASELVSATSAIAAATGPYHGRPVSCSATSALSESCGPRAGMTSLSNSTGGWSNITTSVVPLPSPRFSTMVWDASDGYVLLYGAVYLAPNDSAEQVKDTWSYLNGVWTNLTTEVTGGPPPEPVDPIMAYDPWTSEVILFGGTSTASDNLSLTWTYHALVWTNITATAGTPPSPRWLPVFVADLASHQMILYGGETPTTDRGHDDTWLFSGTTWSNISGSVGTSPPELAFDQGVYDPAESGILVVGTNYAGPPYYADTFLFTGGEWHNLTGAESGNVPMLEIPALGYVSSTSTVLAVASIETLPGTGGQSLYPVEWSFAAGNWTNITAAGDVPGSGSAATVTTLPSGALLMFGGEATSGAITQWMYAYSTGPTAPSVTATPAVTDVGSAINILGSFSGGLAPFQTSIAFGDGGSDNDNLSASHAYSSAGLETIKFNITDLTGRSASATTTVTVNPALNGLAIHATPVNATVGGNVNFTSTISGGTPPYSTTWTFGDGTTALTPTAIHSFAHNGTFEVHLVVSDAVGKSINATLAIVVTAASPSSSGTNESELYLLIGLAVAVVVVLAVIAVVLRRRRPPPTQAGPIATAAPTIPQGPLGNPPTGTPAPSPSDGSPRS
jgi:hypothetical protein